MPNHRPVTALAACLLTTHAAAQSASATTETGILNFDPVKALSGTISTSAYVSVINDDGTSSESHETVETDQVFSEIAIDAKDYGSPIVQGSAWAKGTRYTDNTPAQPGPAGLPIQAIEWRFEAFATASGYGSASARGELVFELDLPVRLMLRAELGNQSTSASIVGLLSAQQGNVRSVIPSSLYQRTINLDPGEYTLTFFTAWSGSRSETDGELNLIVRMEPNPCGPADWNADRAVDHTDIDLFLEAYLGSMDWADLNNDGTTNAPDAQIFTEFFSQRCTQP